MIEIEVDVSIRDNENDTTIWVQKIAYGSESANVPGLIRLLADRAADAVNLDAGDR